MSYKTILVHADSSARSTDRAALAARIAIDHQAHLVGTAITGFLDEFYRYSPMLMAAPIPQLEIDALKNHARAALEEFERTARAIGATAIESRPTDDDAHQALVLQARYADLVVLGQNDPDDAATNATRDLTEYVALQGGRPVLVLPYAGTFERVDRHALVAWDGSRAATRAITDALPLLQRSARVTLVVFNPQRQVGVHGELPGADIALLLARHGVRVEVLRQQTPPRLDVGNALLSLAADLGIDLLVMGAYGHLRWREVLLGGVTHTILKSMTVPVLMSH
jgi:nucleotide-binding universal stress UspA family protein